MVYQVTSKADLEAKFAEAGDKVVVVDFFATWCGPCKRIAPVLEEIANKNADKLVALKVDVDEVEDLVGEYSISVMPTFVFKKKGHETKTVVGSSEDNLRKAVEEFLAL